jgi:hypothetical protein
MLGFTSTHTALEAEMGDVLMIFVLALLELG